MLGVHRSGVAAGKPSFLSADGFAAGGSCVLDQRAAQHIRVLRLEIGAAVGLRDGSGAVGEGTLVRLTKSLATVEVSTVVMVPHPPEVHLLIPVADRDRMLWLAEKACEFGCTSWRPVWWRRSRSVVPRGEGVGFQAKVATRMASALAQSEGAWLPQLFPDATLERALLAAPAGDRVVLDPEAAPLVGPAAQAIGTPLVLALGPEGGIELDEQHALESAGFRRAGLGSGILRFETAGMAALAIARTVLTASTGEERHG